MCQWPEAVLLAGRGEGSRAVAAAVVREQALAPRCHALRRRPGRAPGRRPPSRRARRRAPRRRPAGWRRRRPRARSPSRCRGARSLPAAAEALAAAGADAAQLLGVEVHEVAGMRPAVAHHRLTRLERAQAVQPVAPEGAVDGRRGEVRAPGDPGRAAAPREAQEHDAAQQTRRPRAGRCAAAARSDRARPAAPSARQRASHLPAVWRLTPAAAAASADLPAARPRRARRAADVRAGSVSRYDATLRASLSVLAWTPTTDKGRPSLVNNVVTQNI